MTEPQLNIDEYLANADKEFEDELWLAAHPQFIMKPATILEFLGPKYLNQEVGNATVRPGIKKALVDIFGEEVNTKRIANFQKAMLTGAIGIGKSTFAAIALPYMAHWLLCLKDPQDYFALLPGSSIAIMLMSTSEKQARAVLFSDIFEKIDKSPWFNEHFPRNKLIKTLVEFPTKKIYILPGDSKETTFEGYNIFGGALDEQDSHVITKEKDYADVGYETIEGRMRSRFGKRGFIICIGQMKKSNGFAMRKYHAFLADPTAYVVRMTIWESRGWDWIGEDEDDLYPFLKNCSIDANGSRIPDGEHNSFFYDYKRRQFIPAEAAALLVDSSYILEIPMYYYEDFKNRPEKSLKDLAGIPPTVNDPFISLVDKIEACRDRWIQSSFPEAERQFGSMEVPEVTIDLQSLRAYSPVDSSCTRPSFAPWFSNALIRDPRRRTAHVDIAYSADGDALAIAMGHISGLKETTEGIAPCIKIDFVMRIRAAAGNEIMLSDVRKILYLLRDELKFRLKKITYDGFESTDSVQQLRKNRFEAEKVSMDKSKLAYEDTREAIYEERLEFPPYITELDPGSGKFAEIIVKEFSELQDVGPKIDHPANGSKDCADAIAGVVHELMGDRRYRRGVQSQDVTRRQREPGEDVFSEIDNQATGEKLPWGNVKLSPIQMPGMQSGNVPAHLQADLGIAIPPHLRR